MTTANPFILDLNEVVLPERLVRIGEELYPMLSASTIGPLESVRLRKFGQAALELESADDEMGEERATELMAVLREGVRMILPTVSATEVEGMEYIRLRSALSFFSESTGNTVMRYELECPGCGQANDHLIPTIIVRVNRPTMERSSLDSSDSMEEIL